MALSHTFTNTASPGAASATFLLRSQARADFTAVGTIDAGCRVALQRRVGSNAWTDIKSWSAGSINASGQVFHDRQDNGEYRFLAEVPLTDPATTLASFTATLTDVAATVQEWKNRAGTTVMTVTESGVTITSLSATTVAATSVTADQVTPTRVDLPAGSAASAVALALGATAAEGARIKIIDETVSFVDNTALYKAMTTPIPAGAVILCVQANVQSALTGGGTTVKVGLGPNSSDPDKYGKTSALTKNAKINTVPDWAVLGSQEAIDICACASDGSAGDTALTVGSVRVRIVYLDVANLVNA